MVKTYPILMDGQTVGTATVRREGLYLLFTCQCHIGGKLLYEIIAFDGQHRENLGVLVPVDGEFYLQTRRPAKRFQPGKLVFQAAPKQSRPKGIFVPLVPDVPFTHVHRLQDAFLEVRGGQLGLVVPDLDI